VAKRLKNLYINTPFVFQYKQGSVSKNGTDKKIPENYLDFQGFYNYLNKRIFI